MFVESVFGCHASVRYEHSRILCFLVVVSRVVALAMGNGGHAMNFSVR